MQQILPAISLEITVILLGVLMLFAEAFAKSADRSHMARYAIGVLLALIGFSFFTRLRPQTAAHFGSSTLWIRWLCSSSASPSPPPSSSSSWR